MSLINSTTFVVGAAGSVVAALDWQPYPWHWEFPKHEGILEHAWRQYTTNFTQLQVSVYGSITLHIIVYLLFAIPGLVLPYIPAAQKYKIQKDKTFAPADVFKVMRLVFFNHVFIEAPAFFMIPTWTEYMNIPYDYDSIPSWTTYAWKMLLCLMIEDAWHYWMHRFLHLKSIYPLVHKIHHTFTSPFGMVQEYAHPIETMVLGMGFFIPVLILCDHFVFFYIWFLVRLIETTDVHSGYDFPFNPFHLVPFYGGARAHDAHHSRFNGNYSSTFTYWDKLMGTELKDETQSSTPVSPTVDKRKKE